MKTFPAFLLVGLLGATSLLAANPVSEKADKPAKAADSAPAYPLTTCVVSGEELGSMGKPVEYTHKEEGKPDRVVLFCCKMCVGKFKKEPAKYLAQIDAAAAAKK